MTQLSAMSAAPVIAAARTPRITSRRAATTAPRRAATTAPGRAATTAQVRLGQDDEKMSVAAYLLQGGAFIGFLLVLFVLHLLHRALRPRMDHATYLAYLHDHPSIIWALVGLVVISSLCLAGSLYRDDPAQFTQGSMSWSVPFVQPLVIQTVNLHPGLFSTIPGYSIGISRGGLVQVPHLQA